jgi:hypothetical protein
MERIYIYTLTWRGSIATLSHGEYLTLTWRGPTATCLHGDYL